MTAQPDDNPGFAAKWQDAHRRVVYLSGGGVRATLAGIGAMRWLRTMSAAAAADAGTPSPPKVDAYVSVSGGSLLNATYQLHGDHDAGAEFRLFKRLKINAWNLALLASLLGTVSLLVLAGISQLDGVMAHQRWLVPLLSVWALCLLAIRVVALPLLIATLAFGIQGTKLSPQLERQVAAGAIALALVIGFAIVLHRSFVNRPTCVSTTDIGRSRLWRWVAIATAAIFLVMTLCAAWLHDWTWIACFGICLLGFVAWLARERAHRNDGALDGPTSRLRAWAGAPFVAAALCGLAAAAMWWIDAAPIDRLTRFVLDVVLWGLLGMLAGPRFLRRYLDRVAAVSNWRFGERHVGNRGDHNHTHVYVTTDLRNETPAFFINGLSDAPTVLVTRLPIEPPTYRAYDALKARGFMVLQATASAIPSFAPAIGFGTRRLTIGPRLAPQSLPLFTDGGFTGTLGTQYQDTVDLLAAGTALALIKESQPEEKPSPRATSRYVVDATRRSALFPAWIALLIPKLGQTVMGFRSTQTMLSGLVEEQRNDVKADGSAALVSVTGAAHGRNDGSEFAELLHELRTSTDRLRSWFPSQAMAARAVAAGLVAAIEVTVPKDRRLAVAQRELEKLTAEFGSRDCLPVRWLRLVRNWRGERRPTAATSTDRAPATESAVNATTGATRRECRCNAAWILRGLAVATFIGLGVYPTFFAGDRSCVPLCRPDESSPKEDRHSFFGPPAAGRLRISHEGTLNGVRYQFKSVYEKYGYRYFETDVAWGTATDINADKADNADNADKLALVAAHKTNRATGPSISGLMMNLDDSRWMLEINDAGDKDLTTALTTLINKHGYSDRICVQFGAEVNQAEIALYRQQLGPDACSCASISERLRTSEFWPVKAVALVWTNITTIPDSVDCTTIWDGAAAPIDLDISESNDAMVTLVWSNLRNPMTEERLHQLVEDGFDGFITNDPALLNTVLCEQGDRSPGLVCDAEQPPSTSGEGP